MKSLFALSLITALSAYLPGLKGTAGNVPVYIREAPYPGPTVLLVAGAHGNEAAGMAAARFFQEDFSPAAGRLIVLPCLNTTGYRLLPADHADDSLDSRDINRSYPGSPDGTLARRIAFAVMTLIVAEKVDLAIDLHDAPADSPLANTIVAHPADAALAAEAILALDAQGIIMHLETSPPGLRGISHREWGDRAATASFLVESDDPDTHKAVVYALIDLGRRCAYHRRSAAE